LPFYIGGGEVLFTATLADLANFFFWRRPRPADGTKSKITAFVPLYNKADSVEACLRSILNQTEKPAQLIVSENGSTDGSAEIIDFIAKSYSGPIKIDVIRHSQQTGKAESIEYAAKQLCESEYMLIVDADTELDAKFIENSSKYTAGLANGESVDAVCGAVFSKAPKPGASLSERLIHLFRQGEYNLAVLLRSGQSNVNRLFTLVGCAYLVKREAAAEMPHYTVTEDLEQTKKIQRQWGRVVFEPSAICYTQDPRSFKELNTQLRRWFSGGVQTFLRNIANVDAQNLASVWETRGMWTDILLHGTGILGCLLYFVLPTLAILNLAGLQDFMPARWTLYAFGLMMAIDATLWLYAGKRLGRLKGSLKALPLFPLRFLGAFNYLRSWVITGYQWLRGQRSWASRWGEPSPLEAFSRL